MEKIMWGEQTLEAIVPPAPPVLLTPSHWLLLTFINRYQIKQWQLVHSAMPGSGTHNMAVLSIMYLVPEDWAYEDIKVDWKDFMQSTELDTTLQ